MHTFRREERLRSKKAIDRLFADGSRFYIEPFQVVRDAEPFESDFPVRILISIPKKKIRRAVTRNLLKRRIREAYRQHKHLFCESLKRDNRQCTLALVYTAAVVMDYKAIEEKIILILKRLQREYEKADQ